MSIRTSLLNSFERDVVNVPARINNDRIPESSIVERISVILAKFDSWLLRTKCNSLLIQRWVVADYDRKYISIVDLSTWSKLIAFYYITRTLYIE